MCKREVCSDKGYYIHGIKSLWRSFASIYVMTKATLDLVKVPRSFQNQSGLLKSVKEFVTD